MTDSSSKSGDDRRARRVLVIFNPTAGRQQRRRFEAVLVALRARGCAVELRATERAGHAEDLARGLGPGSADCLVVAGGDGTINEAINGLTERGARKAVLPLAIVPLGTANVLAAEIGLDPDPRAVAQTIAEGRIKTVALGCAGGRVFSVMAGAGFDAHVVDGVDLALKRRIGKGAYLWQAARLLAGFAGPRYRVTVEGVGHEAASVIVAKGRYYAGRFICAPAARLDEPSFQVCLLERFGAWNILRYAAALGMGRLTSLPDYRVLPARRVTIEGPEGDPVQGDGDVIARLPVEIEVLPEALDLVVPLRPARS